MEHAKWLQDVKKIVISGTMDKVEWNNTMLIKDNIAEEIKVLKEQPGKNLVIFGSPGAAKTLLKLGLIDEFLLTFVRSSWAAENRYSTAAARKSGSSCCPAERSSRALSRPAMSWRNSHTRCSANGYDSSINSTPKGCRGRSAALFNDRSDLLNKLVRKNG